MFVHLHVHSGYSLLDGVASPEKLVAKAKELNMPALALTDHGNLYGAIEFYEAAKGEGIKPIIGCEFYSNGDRFLKEGRPKLHHLVLLAKDEEGYKNLLSLITRSYREGYYYKPRIDRELLAECADGLIGLSGCLSGEISSLILEGKLSEAREVAAIYADILGKDNFYLELQDQGLSEEIALNAELLKMSKALSIPVVATNDVHYLERKDAKIQDALLCINTKSTLNDKDRLRFGSDQFHFRTENEMRAFFSSAPEAIENTLIVAESCNVEIPLGQNLIPRYPVPEGETEASYLEKLAREGLRKRYPQISNELEERLEYELNIINKMDFPSYFLIVGNIVSWAKSQGIRVGVGRGSASGSLVSYCLGITGIDPIKRRLLFERFLNPERVSMPDIDLDFDEKRRGEVIEYITGKYGKDKVAQLITFSVLKARAATRDAGRILGVSYPEVDKIAKLIPEHLSLSEALTTSGDLSVRYKNDAKAKEILDIAQALEGIPRQDSIHAAGMVIASQKLCEFVPLQQKGDGPVVTQFEMGAVSKLGLLKMDILGLRNLTVIEKTLQNIEEEGGERPDMEKIPLDDEEVFSSLREGATTGIFQLEGEGMRELLKSIKPENLEDIIATIALYRPGPLGSGMTRDFADCKHGRKEIKYLHPDLKEMLEKTHGVMVYQEQVMQIANKIAGFSMAEADILRKAMSKKKPKEMKKQKSKFIDGATSKGYSADLAKKIFGLMSHFAGYGFNRAHSASYATIAYQTAYLKTHFPREYMAALLSSVADDKDKVGLYVRECKKMGIKVLSPDVNRSCLDFTVEEGGIRFGLLAIKGVGEKAAEVICRVRNRGNYKSFAGFASRCPSQAVTKKTMEVLILAGCFDTLKESRKGLLSKTSGKETIQETLFESALEEEELSLEKRLQMEKKVTGAYLSADPMVAAREKEKDITTVKEAKRLRLGEAKLGGVLSRVKTILTQNGDKMAFASLEDDTDTIDLVIFPNAYEEFKPLLKEGKAVVVFGNVTLRNDEPQMVVQRAKGVFGAP